MGNSCNSNTHSVSCGGQCMRNLERNKGCLPWRHRQEGCSLLDGTPPRLHLEPVPRRHSKRYLLCNLCDPDTAAARLHRYHQTMSTTPNHPMLYLQKRSSCRPPPWPPEIHWKHRRTFRDLHIVRRGIQDANSAGEGGLPLGFLLPSACSQQERPSMQSTFKQGQGQAGPGRGLSLSDSLATWMTGRECVFRCKGHTLRRHRTFFSVSDVLIMLSHGSHADP